MDRNIKNLQEFGLSEDEAKIYFAGLSTGPTTALRLSKLSGVNRTTVYRVVDSLTRAGLMRINFKGLKKQYAVESPENLKRSLEWKTQKLNALLPDLLSVFSKQGKDTLIKYYEGIEGLKSVYESVLREVRRGERYYVISSHKEWYLLDEKWFKSYSERRDNSYFDSKFLLLDSPQAQLVKARAKAYKQQVKLLPKDLMFTSLILLTSHKILIHNMTTPVEGLVIENQDMIEMFFQVFNLLWQTARE